MRGWRPPASVLIALLVGIVALAVPTTGVAYIGDPQPYTTAANRAAFDEIIRANYPASSPTAAAESASSTATKSGLARIRSAARAVPPRAFLSRVNIAAAGFLVGWSIGDAIGTRIFGASCTPPECGAASTLATRRFFWRGKTPYTGTGAPQSWPVTRNYGGGTTGVGPSGGNLPAAGLMWSYENDGSSSKVSEVTLPRATNPVASLKDIYDGFDAAPGTRYVSDDGLREVKVMDAEKASSVIGISSGYTGATPETVTAARWNVEDPATAPVSADAQTADARAAVAAPENADARQWINDQLDPTWDDPQPGPIYVPQPNPAETYASYLNRLQALGLVGSLRQETEVDPRFGPDAVTGLSPSAGTQVASGATVIVRANPATAPAVVTAPLPSAPAGGCEPWVRPAVNLTPLSTSLGDKFPFAIMGWIGGALQGWEAAREAPAFSIPFPVTGDALTIDFAVVEPLLIILRPVMVIIATLSIIWWLATSLLGLSEGRASAGEDA